jgi:hypothetical protein
LRPKQLAKGAALAEAGLTWLHEMNIGMARQD